MADDDGHDDDLRFCYMHDLCPGCRGYGNLSRPTRRQPPAVRRKYTSTGRVHSAGAGSIAETWTRTNAPTDDGSGPGAAISLETDVVAGPSDRVWPVALSNSDQLGAVAAWRRRGDAGVDAALRKLRRPSPESAKSTSGLIAGR